MIARARHLAAALVAVALLLLAAGEARAQLEIHPGVEAGWQMSTIIHDSWQQVANTRWTGSLTAGFTLEMPLVRTVGIATGARVVRYANHAAFGFPGQPVPDLVAGFTTGALELHADYVAVPLLASAAPDPRFGLRLAGGVETQFLVSTRLVAEGVRAGGGRASVDVDAPRQLAPVNVALCATLGWAMPRRGHGAIARLRFTRGLSETGRAGGLLTGPRTVGLDGTLGARW